MQISGMKSRLFYIYSLYHPHVQLIMHRRLHVTTSSGALSLSKKKTICFYLKKVTSTSSKSSNCVGWADCIVLRGSAACLCFEMLVALIESCLYKVSVILLSDISDGVLPCNFAAAFFLSNFLLFYLIFSTFCSLFCFGLVAGFYVFWDRAVSYVYIRRFFPSYLSVWIVALFMYPCEVFHGGILLYKSFEYLVLEGNTNERMKENITVADVQIALIFVWF